MKKLFTILSLMILTSFSIFSQESTFAVKDWHRLENKTVALDCDWDFYYGRFVPYGSKVRPDLKVKIPHHWNDYKIDELNNLKEGKGAGTFRLKITNLRPNTKYSFLTYKAALSAFEVYADENLIFKSGEINEDFRKTKMQQYMNLAEFSSDANGCVTLTFFVSNYEYRKGGLQRTIKIQESKSYKEKFFRKLIVYDLVGGTLITIIIYSFILFGLEKQKTHLYLALFVLSIFLRIFTESYPVIKYFFPHIPYHIMLRLEYIALFFAPGVFTLYVNSLNKNIFKNVNALLLASPAFVFLLLDIALPLITLNRLVPIMQIWCFISITINLIFIIINACKEKNMITYTTLFTIIIIGFGTFTNIMYTRGVDLFNGHEFLSESFALYGMCQTILLAWIQNKNREKVTELNNYLEEVNKAYYRFVPKEFLKFLSKKDITELNAGELHSAKMAILSADIRNFTTISEQLTETKVFEMLNSYLKKIAPIIRKNNGIIEKYLGDGIIAIFPESAESALVCSIEMQEQMIQLRKEFVEKELPKIKIGIGVHYGNVTIGTGGNRERISEVLISKDIDITVKAEASTKTYQRPIIVTKPVLIAALKEAKLQNRSLNFSGSRVKTNDNSELFYIYNDITGKAL